MAEIDIVMSDAFLETLMMLPDHFTLSLRWQVTAVECLATEYAISESSGIVIESDPGRLKIVFSEKAYGSDPIPLMSLERASWTSHCGFSLIYLSASLQDATTCATAAESQLSACTARLL
jgi:hypothetical protein